MKSFLRRLFDKNGGGYPVQIIETRDNQKTTITQNQYNIMTESKEGSALIRTLIEQSGSANETPSKELISKLLDETIKNIKSFINAGNINEALKLINGLVSSSGFNLLPTEEQSQILYYSGVINLDRENIEGARNDANSILVLEGQVKKGYELELKIAAMTGERRDFELVLGKLCAIGLTNEEFLEQQIFFEVSIGNFEEAIKIGTVEDNKIDKMLINRKNALYYLGIAFLNTSHFKVAYELISKSIEKENSNYKQYLIILAEILPCINKPIKFSSSSNGFEHPKKDLLNVKLVELLKLREYAEKKSIEFQVDYWGYVLTLKLFVNPQEILTDISELPEEIKNKEPVRLMLAEYYFVLKSYDEAIHIYEELYGNTKNRNILEKIIVCLYEKEDYKGIVSLIENTKAITVETAYSDIVTLYIIAYKKVSEYDNLIEKINELENIYKNESLFYNIAARVVHGEDKELGVRYLSKALEKVDENVTTDEIFIISETCKIMQRLDFGIELLQAINTDTTSLKIELAKFLVDTQDATNIEKANRILEEIPENEINSNVLDLRAHINLYNDNYKEALNILTVLYQEVPNDYTAYLIILSKLNINDDSNAELYVRHLLRSENPVFLMMGAFAQKVLLSEINAGVKNAYKSLAILKDKYVEQIYFQYIAFFLPFAGETLEGVSIPKEKVDIDCVVKIVDNDGESRFICIEKGGLDGEYYLNCERYNENSEIALLLLGMKKGEKVCICDSNYTIEEIFDKYFYVYQHCAQKHFEINPESKGLRQFSFDKDDPYQLIEKMVPILSENYEKKKRIIEQVQRAQLPLSSVSNQDYSLMFDVIHHFYWSKDEIFNSGKPIPRQLGESDRIVIDLTTLVFLKVIDKLEVLDIFKDRIHITQSTYNVIEQSFNKSRETENTVGTMYLEEGLHPRINRITPEDHKRNMELWRDILLAVRTFNICDELDVPDLIPARLNVDIEPIVLAHKLNGVFISEDLFIKNLKQYMYPGSLCTNVMSLLDSYYNVNKDKYCEYLDLLLELSKNKYYSICTPNNLVNILKECILKQQILLAEGTPSNKFILTIKNLLSDKRFVRVHLSIIRDIIHMLYDMRIDIKAITLLEMLIKEVKVASTMFNVDTLLITFILEPCGLDVIKEEFINSIYKRV
ncbi:hypothetical protein AJ85_18045 [Alkalihalobacillus alcalophilus ATCC 27647 = CGMCC 1.3604]|uniref:PIN domain-containing protein n=1 Tax=Alkalihalobacillus alcalophilus ATCC 27647 = CGMCC 1.3604 TaxID=1218173 RepID=A0A094XAS6_ALKAL|nr:hypothetical protein [Alkalihalobacillus alcalophilus]KGA95880.1 hypothetical protein BALCAV_0219715 [Alkalihalobacillus alcalophilus ATCC 27647 = CGMCC 1.3604]MED1560558.1 hypothetical protein [Alkalihalobacillus alcalophilus]THG89368.1 hypothetical protein AJ85_18045 [Alkalihalobacillus alcalophilus ATCC 27647 = CGMCC 1.3604]